MSTATTAAGKVIQVAGPAIDIQFPEGHIPPIRTAIRITSEGFNAPTPIDIICEVAQHIGENRVRTIALQPTEGMVRGMQAISLGAPIVELFDSWDQTLATGSDTEANVAVVALCIGVAFAIGTIVIINRIRALASASGRRVVLRAAAREIASLLGPAPTGSPPLILRV